MVDQIMAESKAPKPGLIRRILWWLWVVLLTALLVLGFVFAAPWKVITLIAIFLAVATILPRVYRKWFWLGIGIVVLATIAWTFLPDDNKDWRPYTFDKELAQLQARYAVPDSENAAILYNQILANWKQKEANEPNLPYDKLDLARHTFWQSNDQPEIAAYIQYHQDTIEQLIQASKLKQCSFPIIADAFVLGEQMERISTVRSWAYLLIAAGNNNMAEGDANDAVAKYLAVLRMGQHMSRQPSVIEMLVSLAIKALAFGGVNNFVVWGDANEPYLIQLEQAVSEIRHDWNSDLPGFIDSDKLMFKNMLGGLFYEVNSKGGIRFSRDPMAKVRDQTPKQLANEMVDDNDIFSGYWWKKVMKAHTIPAWFYIPTTPDKLSEIVDASFEKHYMMTSPNFDWSKKIKDVPMESLIHWRLNFRYLTKLSAEINRNVYFGLHETYLRIAAQQRGTQLIIAMRRYKNANGHWPEKLEDIKISAPAEIFVDPINGDSFVYKLTDENFMLYSKGKNNIDDGGKREKSSFSSFGGEEKKVLNKGCDDFMIWPAKSPESKKNNDEKQ